MPQLLRVGTEAPDFSLPSTEGHIRLSSFRNKSNVVLVFYIRNNTPG
ncbi:MAG: redoxin domain-containing protein [Fidelibacterota bacterium]